MLPIMNDATLKQIAAAKVTVTKGSHVRKSNQAARAQVRQRVLMAPAPNTAQFGVLICPPMAPELLL